MITFDTYRSNHSEQVFRTILQHTPDGPPVSHAEAVRAYTLRRSKYFRSNIALLWCEMMEGDKNTVFPFACALEAAQDWFLIHDDWMDNNDLRRGKPAAHVLYGDAEAINAGDAMQTVSWKIAYEESRNIPQKIRDALFAKLFDIILTTEAGQHRDLELARKDIGVFELDEYWDSIHAKAAYYSVYGPMQLGIIAAGGSQEDIHRVTTYGVPAGKSFQVRDDILDCVGTSQTTGKQIGTDILQGTKTVILWHFMRNAPHDLRSSIERIYRKPREQKNQDDIAAVIRAFQKTGSIAYAETTAEKLATEADTALDAHLANLSDTPLKKTARDMLGKLIKRSS